MWMVKASFALFVVTVFAACAFDPSGVQFDEDDDKGATLSPPNIDDRAPVGDFPDGGVVASTCLIISEYIEGQGNNNKAIELFNCGDTTLSLADFGVCLVTNASTSCNYTYTFASGTLEPGAVVTMCRTLDGTKFDPMDPLRDNCQLAIGNTMNFNGDDRLVVFRDSDDDGQLGDNDEVMDAFGQISSQPPDFPWSELTLRRCNFTPVDGVGEFVHTDYYTEHPRHDTSDFGIAPTQGC